MTLITKHLTVLTFALLSGTTINAQYNTYPYPNAGFIGLGLASTTTTPNFNLQIHGTTDYISPPGKNGVPGTNYGISSRIGLTHGTTGTTALDGVSLRLSQSDFRIDNQENGALSLASGGVVFTISGGANRVYLGGSVTGTQYGLMNYTVNADNGVYIKTLTSGKYGLSIQSQTLTDNAIQVIGTDGAILPRFMVKASGAIEMHTTSTLGTDKLLMIKNVALSKTLLQLTNDGILRSREIIVDAQTWSDYVFEPTYKLMSLEELEQYISTNKHLPNVPSTADVEKDGVNLAKTDAILLEKIEELTLYILQQQEQLTLQKDLLKGMQKEIETLKNAPAGN